MDIRKYLTSEKKKTDISDGDDVESEVGDRTHSSPKKAFGESPNLKGASKSPKKRKSDALVANSKCVEDHKKMEKTAKISKSTSKSTPPSMKTAPKQNKVKSAVNSPGQSAKKKSTGSMKSLEADSGCQSSPFDMPTPPRKSAPKLAPSEDTLFPVAKIRSIMKSVPSLDMISVESAAVINKATEMFTRLLSERGLEEMQNRKGKTLDYDDLASFAAKTPKLRWIRDVLTERVTYDEYLKESKTVDEYEYL